MEKYLNLLNLDKNFTQEQLRKAYRSRMKAVHPDRILESGLSEEEANALSKEINEAYEKLTNYLENGRVKFAFYHENNTFDVKAYRYGKLVEIGEILTDKKLIEKYDIDEYIDKFDSIIIEMSNSKTKEDVDNLYSNFKEEYKSMLLLIKRIYYSENYIDINEVTEKLNYELPIKEFYNSLEKLKAKYSKTYEIESKLSNEVEKFRLYTYFEELEEHIDRYKKALMERVGQNKLKNTDSLVSEFVAAINNLFINYSAFIIRINELLKQCDLIKSDKSLELKERLINIKDNYKPSNDYIQNALNNIEREIQEEINYQNKLEEVTKVNTIIEKNYESALNLCKETESNDTRFMDVFSLYTRMYNDVFNKKMKIDDFFALESLTFTDYEKDMELIVSIMLKSNAPRIFIANESWCRSNYYAPRVIFNLGNNEIKYLNNENLSCTTRINYSDLKNNYTNLNKYLRTVCFSGKVIKHEMSGERFLILYKADNSDYALVLKENGVVDLININSCRFEENLTVNTDTEKLKDKKELEKYICSTILTGKNKLNEEEVFRKK